MSGADPFEADRGPTLRGQLKETIGDVNDHDQRNGADVDEVVSEVIELTEYTEADIRETLKQMLLEGEVYPPKTGRVKVTPS